MRGISPVLLRFFDGNEWDPVLSKEGPLASARWNAVLPSRAFGTRSVVSLGVVARVRDKRNVCYVYPTNALTT